METERPRVRSLIPTRRELVGMRTSRSNEPCVKPSGWIEMTDPSGRGTSTPLESSVTVTS